MKRIISTLSLTILAGAAFAQAAPEAVTPASKTIAAPAAGKRIEARESRQKARIDAGFKNGSVSPVEAAKLEKQQANIDTMATKAEADGKVTKAEASKIAKAQNHASKTIKHAKHNKPEVK